MTEGVNENCSSLLVVVVLMLSSKQGRFSLQIMGAKNPTYTFQVGLSDSSPNGIFRLVSNYKVGFYCNIFAKLAKKVLY